MSQAIFNPLVGATLTCSRKKQKRRFQLNGGTWLRIVIVNLIYNKTSHFMSFSSVLFLYHTPGFNRHQYYITSPKTNLAALYHSPRGRKITTMP